MRYIVKMRNVKSGKVTEYASGDMTESELAQCMELFEIGGCEIMSTRSVTA